MIVEERHSWRTKLRIKGAAYAAPIAPQTLDDRKVTQNW